MYKNNRDWEDFYTSTFEVCPAEYAHKKLSILNKEELKQFREYLETSFNKAHADLELQYSARYMVDKLIKNKELEKEN